MTTYTVEKVLTQKIIENQCDLHVKRRLIMLARKGLSVSCPLFLCGWNCGRMNFESYAMRRLGTPAASFSRDVRRAIIRFVANPNSGSP